MKIEGIEITHPDALVFPGARITKGGLARYYDRIAIYMLPYLKDRPVSLQRFPKGIDHPGFFQKHAQDYFPDFIDRIPVKTKAGSAVEILVNHKKSLLYLVNLSVVTFHTWLSRKGALEYPDKVIFDLDPSNGDFDTLKRGALLVREMLAGKDIDARLMTTGKKGVHLYYPICPERPFDEVRARIRAWAEVLVEKHPDLFTLEIRKKKRGNKIFLDLLRNAYAQTGVCPYSLRPNHNAGVATPLECSELSRLNSGDQYTYHTIFKRLETKEAQRRDTTPGN